MASVDHLSPEEGKFSVSTVGGKAGQNQELTASLLAPNPSHWFVGKETFISRHLCLQAMH